MNITYITECECGGEAEHRGLDLTQDNPNEVRINFAFSCSQMTLECPKCEKKYYTGDIEVLSEDEI